MTLVAFRFASAASDDGDQLYRFARGLYARQQWEAASDELDRFLQQHPNHPEAAQAEFYLGEALVQQRRYDDAAKRFQRYWHSQPDGTFRAQAMFRLAECDFLGNRPGADRRLAEFSAAFDDNRLNGLVLNYRGQIALRQGDAGHAEVLFQQSLERFPDGVSQDECRMGLARALEVLGRADEAERYYFALSAKRNSPASIEAKYRLGCLQYAQRQYASALDTFTELESAAQSTPWAASAGLGRGWALMKLDRNRDAGLVFSRLADHPQVAVQARYWLGLCRKAEKNWPGALEAFLAAAAKLDEERPRPRAAQSAKDVTETAVFFHAGDAQLAAANLDEARKHFDRAIAAGKENDLWFDDARRASVQTSLRLKDHGRARSDAERFLAECPGSPMASDLLRLLVRIHLEQHDYHAAERTLCRLDETNLGKPDAVEDLYLLALSYQGQRRFEKAMQTLQPVLAGASGNLAADVRLVEASLLAEMSRYEDALQTLATHKSLIEMQGDPDQSLALSAICHLRLGRGDEALGLYQGAFANTAESTPLRWDAAEQIAQAMLDDKDYEQAEALYREIAEGDVEDNRKHRAILGLAWTQHGRNDDNLAETTLTGLLETTRDAEILAEARFLRGRVLRDLGRLEAACQAFMQLVRDHPQSTYECDALCDAAQLHERLGRPQEAAESYERILDFGPAHSQHAAALYNLAWIRREEGRTDEAASLFRRVATEYHDSPYWAHAILSVAQHDLDAGRRAEAGAIINELLNDEQSKPVRDRALYLAGQIALASAEWLQAQQRFEQLVNECPQSDLCGTAAFAAAEAAFQGKDSETLTLFERFVGDTHAVNDMLLATARMRLAQLYAESGRWDEASAVAESFAEAHPDFPRQYELDYVRGRCLAARALFAEARETYERVIRSPTGERTETAAKAQLMVAETFFHQRLYADAYRAYMQVEILYDYPELRAAALLQAGKCRQLQGNLETAADLYRQVLENHPGTRAAEQAAKQLDRET
jgi:TolA-binding protein